MDSVVVKSGRKYKLADPNEKCPTCHQTAKELGCKTVMSMAQHKAGHRRHDGSATVLPLIVGKRKRKGQELAVATPPAPNGTNVVQAIQAAMTDVQRSMLLLQFASLLPRISVDVAQNTLTKLARYAR